MSDSPSPESPHISRPPNSFFLYRIDKNKEMKETKTNSGPQSQISKAIAQQWHREPLSVKIAYKKRADAAKERHAQLHPHYRYKAGKKKVKSDAHPAYRKIGPQTTQLGVPLDDYPSVFFPQNGGSPVAGPSGYTSPGPSASSHNLRPRKGTSYVQPNSEQGIPNHMSMEEYRNLLVTHQLHQQYTATRAYAEQAWHILRNHLLRTTTQFHSGPPNNYAQAAQHAMLTQMQYMPLRSPFPMNDLFEQTHAAPVADPAYMPWQMGPPGPSHAGQPWQWNDQHAPLNAGFSNFDFANATAPADVAQRVPTPRIRRAPVQPQYPLGPLDVGSFDLTRNSEGASQVHAQISLPTIPQALEIPLLNESLRGDPYFQGAVVSAETGMLQPPSYIFPSTSATLDTGVPPQDSLLLGEASSSGLDPLDAPFPFSSRASSTASGSQDPLGAGDLDCQDQTQSHTAADTSLGPQEEGSSLWAPSDRSADHLDSTDAQGWFNFQDE